MCWACVGGKGDVPRLPSQRPLASSVFLSPGKEWPILSPLERVPGWGAGQVDGGGGSQLLSLQDGC